MHHIITTRVVKHGTGTREKFAPRTTNVEAWHISGPFSSRKLAERAAALSLGTHTALSARVVTDDDLAAILGASAFDALYSHQHQRAVKAYLGSVASSTRSEAVAE